MEQKISDFPVSVTKRGSTPHSKHIALLTTNTFIQDLEQKGFNLPLTRSRGLDSHMGH